jgi:hypothetical protein
MKFLQNIKKKKSIEKMRKKKIKIHVNVIEEREKKGRIHRIATKVIKDS